MSSVVFDWPPVVHYTQPIIRYIKKRLKNQIIKKKIKKRLKQSNNEEKNKNMI